MSPPIHNRKNTRRLGERLRFTTSRLRVYVWPEHDTNKAVHGFGFLSDLSENGVGLYLGKALPRAEAIRLAFGKPDAAPFRGKVIWVERFALEQHFVGENVISYRLGAQLLFASEAERLRYMDFLDEQKRNIGFLKAGITF